MAVSDYDSTFDAAGKEWNVDPNLLRAVAQQESGGNPNAQGTSGEVGVMQLMPQTAQGLGVANRADPTQSIYGGAKMLSGLLDKYKNPQMALAAYNGGAANVDNNTIPAQTLNQYVPLIAQHYAKFAKSNPQASVAPPAAAAPAGQSDADFLSATGAKPGAASTATPAAADASAPAGQSDADFLAATGARAPTPAPVVSTAPGASPDAANFPDVTKAPAAVGDVLSASLAGAKAGFGSEPLGLGRPAINALQQSGIYPPAAGGGTMMQNVNQAVIDPVSSGVDLLRRGLGAASGAVGGFVGQGIQALGGSPALARDVVGIPGAFAGSPNELAAAPPVANRLSAPEATAAPLALSSEFKGAPYLEGSPAAGLAPDPLRLTPPINQLAAPAEAAPTSPVPWNQPVAQPIPNGLTPAQVAEFKSIPDALPPMKGEIKTQADADARADQIVQHFSSIGNTTPIPGAVGSLPTITGNSGLATLYRAVRDSDTPVPFTTLEDAGKANANATLASVVQTPDALAAATKARADSTAPLYQSAWANKGVADTDPIVAGINDTLAGPQGQKDAVQAHLSQIQTKLAGQTDPEHLHAIMGDIDDRLNAVPGSTNDGRAASRQLGAVRDQIQAAISDSTPGFDKAQQSWAQQSGPIDEMKWLQNRGLTNQMDNTTLGKIDGVLNAIQKGQASDKFGTVDGVSPQTVQTLQNLKAQMQREQFTATAGKALGSNTFQNAATNSVVGRVAGGLGNNLLSTAAGGTLGYMTGGHEGGMVGALSGQLGSNVLKGISERSAAKAAARQDAGRAMLMNSLRDRVLNVGNKGVNALNGGS